MNEARYIDRFAPSPTGELHLGHAFSALTGWRASVAAGGRFLLRIEDLDRGRSRPEFVEAIYRDLAWIGVEWEQPVMFQSARLAAYRAALDRLADLGLTYPCTCTRRDITEAVAAPPEGTLPAGPAVLVYPVPCLDAGQPPGRPAAIRLSMRRAIAAAEVGNEQAGEDPTTNRLQDMVAALLGQEDAVFLPSGTMCNAVAYREYGNLLRDFGRTASYEVSAVRNAVWACPGLDEDDLAAVAQIAILEASVTWVEGKGRSLRSWVQQVIRWRLGETLTASRQPNEVPHGAGAEFDDAVAYKQDIGPSPFGDGWSAARFAQMFTESMAKLTPADRVLIQHAVSGASRAETARKLARGYTEVCHATTAALAQLRVECEVVLGRR